MCSPKASRPSFLPSYISLSLQAIQRLQRARVLQVGKVMKHGREATPKLISVQVSQSKPSRDFVVTSTLLKTGITFICPPEVHPS